MQSVKETMNDPLLQSRDGINLSAAAWMPGEGTMAAFHLANLPVYQKHAITQLIKATDNGKK